MNKNLLIIFVLGILLGTGVYVGLYQLRINDYREVLEELEYENTLLRNETDVLESKICKLEENLTILKRRFDELQNESVDYEILSLDELKFLFNTSLIPAEHYEGNDDTTNLSAAFEYIEFLDSKSHMLKRIDFDPSDAEYLVEGWYGIEDWDYTFGSWSDKESIIRLEIPDEAHFLRFRAHSVGRTGYKDLEVGFKESKTHPNMMKVYLNGKIVDEVPLCGRTQIHYANLKPELDSDGDGIINKDDVNSRIPEPRPVESDVSIAVYYITPWDSGTHRLVMNDWAIGTPLHPLLGEYDSDDPDVADWHIKWAVEHGVNVFVGVFTNPLSGWENRFEDGLLRAKYLPYIRYFMALNMGPWLPGNRWGNDPNLFEEKTLEATKYFVTNYFDRPQYLRIENNSVMFLGDAHHLHDDYIGPEDFPSYINLIREAAKNYGHDIYLIGHVMDTGVDVPIRAKELIEPFDAISSYNIINAGEDGWDFDELGNYIKPYDSMVTGYIELSEWWSNQALKYSRGFIPPLCPGFNTRYLYEVEWTDVITERTDPTPDKFQVMCEGIMPFIDPDLNMVIVEAWNEYHEESVIEPTFEFGFRYLDTLREVFTDAPHYHEDEYH